MVQLEDEIRQLKEDRNAVVVAHNYQRDEVQAVADKVGDSLALARFCAETDAAVIVFCGVHFMAESASLLSPEKTVLLPVADAGCPMADMVGVDELKAWRRDHPGIPVVCYINSSAAVKAESDIICTSSNAVAVVRSLPDPEILFIPDRNLGQYVADQVPEKKVHLWPGFCPTHDRIRAVHVEEARAAHPDAVLLVHPECRPEVCRLADFVGSTKQILDHARTSPASTFLIGTEEGVLWTLRRENPGKRFFLAGPGFFCPNMKKTTLESVRDALVHMRHVIQPPPDTADRARAALARMLAVR